MSTFREHKTIADRASSDRARHRHKIEKAIKLLYPNAKSDEIEMLSAVNTKKEIVKYLEDLGYDDKQIKELL